MKIEKAIERIECPICEHQFNTEVEWREIDPWPTYVAECPRCDYIITESEWNCIEVVTPGPE